MKNDEPAAADIEKVAVKTKGKKKNKRRFKKLARKIFKKKKQSAHRKI